MAATSVEEYEHAATTRYWPEDVIQEILVRLPIKSILIFKSTCKSWYALLRSRSFIDFQRQFHLLNGDDHMDELFFSLYHSNTARGCFFSAGGACVISSLSPSSSGLKRPTRVSDLGTLRRALAGPNVRPPLVKTLAGNNEAGIRVLGPLSNGISCVIGEEFVGNAITDEFVGRCKVAFCNLATREFNLLTDPFPFIRRGIGTDVFAFHYHYGFGMINKRCKGPLDQTVVADYKMVAIQCCAPNSIIRASVYSLRRGRWDLICDSSNPGRCSPNALAGLMNENGELQFPQITQCLYWLPVQALLNGCCHWMAKMPPNFENCILQFDMDNEVFGLIAGPPNSDDYYKYNPDHNPKHDRQSGVFVLQDHLAAVITANDGHHFKPRVYPVAVWMMVEYGVATSWTKIHSFGRNLYGPTNRLLGMSFSNGHEESQLGNVTIDRIFCETLSGYLVSCGPSGAERLSTFDRLWACWKPLGLATYVETLEPVSLELEDLDEDTS